MKRLFLFPEKCFFLFLPVLIAVFFAGDVPRHLSLAAEKNPTEISSENSEVDELLGIYEADPFSDEEDAVPVKAEKSPQKAEKPSVEKPKKKNSGVSLTIPGIFPPQNAGKDAAEEAPEENIPHARLEDVIPECALLIVRTPSLETLMEREKYFFAQLGFGTFSPTDWLKFSPYGKCLPHVDMKHPAAVVYVPYGNLPARMVFIPVKNYRKFAGSLGANLENLPDPVREGFVSVLQNPPNHLVYLKGGYAVLVEPVPAEMMRYLWNVPAFSRRQAFTPSGMKNPHLSVEFTREGILHGVELAKIALGDFAPVFSETMKSLDIPDPELELAEVYFDYAVDAVQWMEENLAGVRVDLCVKKETVLHSATFSPLPDSRFMTQVRDTTGPTVSTTLEMNRFLKIVPDLSSPFAGQVDMTQDVASRLEAPFHRVRHVEYSFILPGRDEFLAQRWCFFLEVDDSEAFIKELIIPKAQMVGSHVASSAMGDIGAKVAENFAKVRQDRQGRRIIQNRPLLLKPADPNAAATRGEEIGMKIGNLIGKIAGEKEGMKTYDFDGYSLYISDLELYAREMKKIRAEQAGDFSHRPGISDNFRMSHLIQRTVLGLQRGDLQQAFGDVIQQYLDAEAFGEDAPLLASRNLVLVLDATHLLIVPGNEDVLRMAKDNWEKVRNLYYSEESLPAPPAGHTPLPRGKNSYTDGNRSGIIPAAFSPVLMTAVMMAPGKHFSWQDSWDAIRKDVLEPENHLLRTATRVDAAGSQRLSDVVRKYYLPQMPQFFSHQLPDDTPPTLTISTVAGDHGFFYMSFPHELSKNLMDMYLKMMRDKMEE